MKKIIASLFLSCVLFVSTAEASLISFLVVETGLSHNSGRNRHSVLWENAFMDVFFDSGYIVSNYPMQRLDYLPEGNIQDISGFDVFEAKDASVNYILIAQLDFNSPINAPDLISLFVFKVEQHEIIYEKQIKGKTYGSERDANNDLKNIIRELVKFVVNL